MTESEPAAGWYPHPSMADTQRYWDGLKWTDHIAPGLPEAYRAQPQVTTVHVAEPDHGGLIAAALVFALIFPALGFILGIVLMAKGKVGAGIVAVLLSCLAMTFWYQVYFPDPEPISPYYYGN